MPVLHLVELDVAQSQKVKTFIRENTVNSDNKTGLAPMWAVNLSKGGLCSTTINSGNV